MYTDPNHIKVSDPGNVENNTVFIYLDAFVTNEHFEKYLPEYKNLDELKAHYQRGGLGDMVIKNFLFNGTIREIGRIIEYIKEWVKNIGYFSMSKILYKLSKTRTVSCSLK